MGNVCNPSDHIILACNIAFCDNTLNLGYNYDITLSQAQARTKKHLAWDVAGIFTVGLLNLILNNRCWSTKTNFNATKIAWGNTTTNDFTSFRVAQNDIKTNLDISIEKYRFGIDARWFYTNTLTVEEKVSLLGLYQNFCPSMNYEDGIHTHHEERVHAMDNFFPSLANFKIQQVEQLEQDHEDLRMLDPSVIRRRMSQRPIVRLMDAIEEQQH